MSATKVTATRGILLRLKEELAVVQRSKELLELKRDQLAREINKLLNQLKFRKEIEKEMMKCYEELDIVLTSMGYWDTKSRAELVTPIKVEVKQKVIMGTRIPTIKIERAPEVKKISDVRIYKVAKRYTNLIQKIITLTQTEAQIEKLAYELMMTNRKVNILEKVVIPDINRTIRYIEDKLEEESLEEFIRAKKIKQVITRE